MCRSIRTLRGAEPPAGEADIHAAALQFVRKVSGFRAPSARNRDAFDRAVGEVSDAVSRLLEGIAERSRGGPGTGPAAATDPGART
jgi:hypothetical protein